jgi:hypothetical protein
MVTKKGGVQAKNKKTIVGSWRNWCNHWQIEAVTA